MGEAKPFYEIEKPAKKTYAVVVIEIKNDAECKHTDPIFNKAGDKVGALVCDANPGGEVYDCACCNMPACEDHLSEVPIHNDYVCKVCAKLPPGVIEEIIQFRERLNQP